MLSVGDGEGVGVGVHRGIAVGISEGLGLGWMATPVGADGEGDVAAGVGWVQAPRRRVLASSRNVTSNDLLMKRLASAC